MDNLWLSSFNNGINSLTVATASIQQAAPHNHTLNLVPAVLSVVYSINADSPTFLFVCNTVYGY